MGDDEGEIAAHGGKLRGEKFRPFIGDDLGVMAEYFMQMGKLEQGGGGHAPLRQAFLGAGDRGQGTAVEVAGVRGGVRQQVRNAGFQGGDGGAHGCRVEVRGAWRAGDGQAVVLAADADGGGARRGDAGLGFRFRWIGRWKARPFAAQIGEDVAGCVRLAGGDEAGVGIGEGVVLDEKTRACVDYRRALQAGQGAKDAGERTQPVVAETEAL